MSADGIMAGNYTVATYIRFVKFPIAAYLTMKQILLSLSLTFVHTSIFMHSFYYYHYAGDE